MPISDASHPMRNTPMHYHKAIGDKNWEDLFIYFTHFSLNNRGLKCLKFLKNLQLHFVLSVQQAYSVFC